MNSGEVPPDSEHDYAHPEDPSGDRVSFSRRPAALAPAGGGMLSGPDDDDEDSGMLRMSFMDHLEELRSRIIKALGGFGLAFLFCLIFANEIWEIVSQPATIALTNLGINPPNLVQVTPMEAFSTIWVKVPLVISLFLGAPWILWQLWAFIAPGLYDKEKKLAVPFVLTSGLLFILGGVFAYFIAFRYGLTFLLGIGRNVHVTPMVSITEYFDLFVNVVLGVALVFELPVVIFLLTLLRVASPSFLLEHSRYAILAIVMLAAVITPTPDVFNLMLFAVPMTLLFFLGVFASYLLVLRRENRKFPWAALFKWLIAVVIVVAGFGAMLIAFYGLHFVKHWPFFVK